MNVGQSAQPTLNPMINRPTAVALKFDQSTVGWALAQQLEHSDLLIWLWLNTWRSLRSVVGPRPNLADLIKF